MFILYKAWIVPSEYTPKAVLNALFSVLFFFRVTCISE